MSRVVLASASPRRHELLKQVIPEFEIMPSGIDEDALTVADPWRTAEGLAEAKALDVFGHLGRPSDTLVIGCDTVVALEEPGGFRQLTKPVDADDAFRILTTLSGRTHRVITGVSIVCGQSAETFSDTTFVTFRDLQADEIRAYIAGGEPMDKAGAYGCQGGGQKFIDKIDGSFENVVGLPIQLLARRLRARFGLP